MGKRFTQHPGKDRIQCPVTQWKLDHEVFTWPLMANPARPQENMLVPVIVRIWTRLPASIRWPS